MFYIIMILRKISKFPSIQNYATTPDISDNICLYITSCAPLFICEKKYLLPTLLKSIYCNSFPNKPLADNYTTPTTTFSYCFRRTIIRMLYFH